MALRGTWLPWLGLAVAFAVAAVGVVTQPTPVALAGVALAALYGAALEWGWNGARRIAAHTEQSLHAALHDPVTDLPNRILFHDRVQHAIEHADRLGGSIAVLLLDLDRFKEVNDTLGHHNGDLLLHQVGRRLVANVRASDSVARLGGDEFAVLLVDIEGEADAREVAACLHEAIAERIEIEGIGIEVEPSIGIALSPEHGVDPELLLQHADVAMYKAKRTHCAQATYEGDADSYSRARLELMAGLRRAIEQGEIVLHFQPKALLAEGRVTEVEALARWEHPERGLLGPMEFIPFAEMTGLMRPLTLHVIDRALAQVRSWAEEGLQLGVAVNVSTRNLLDLSFPDDLARLLDRYDVPASRLELEVTETTIMADPARSKAVLARLDAIGVGLAVDDFGTGYTALGWLRELPLSTLKIDRSFVGSMASNGDDAVIVRSTVQLGRNLGMRVIAEGVEDQECWDELADLGCDMAQGFLLSRPQPAELLTPWLRARDGDLDSGGATDRLEDRRDLGVVG